MRKSAPKKTKTSSKQPLENVICCVETFNCDGSDASASTKTALQAMGATVDSDGIKMGLTHMIWSNGNTKHVKAAEFMDIIVVSPLWVEQCHESNAHVPESDFLVSLNGTSDTAATAKRFEAEPTLAEADCLPDPSSPSFSSSQRFSSEVSSRPLRDISTSAGNRSRPSKSSTSECKYKCRDDNKVVKPSGAENENKLSHPSPDTASIASKSSSKASKAPRKNSTTKSSTSSINNTTTSSTEETAGSTVSKISSHTISSSSRKSKSLKSPRLFALSGFEGEDRALLGDISQTLVTLHPDSSLASDDDFSLSTLTGCTHIVAASNQPRRTLRVLFALAGGVPVVTEQWLFASLEAGEFVDYTPHLHPRFSHVSLVERDPLPVYVGMCKDPTRHKLKALVNHWAGYTKDTQVLSEAQIVITEGIGELQRSLSKEDAAYLMKLRESRRVLTCKDFFDCIESGSITSALELTNLPVSDNKTSVSTPLMHKPISKGRSGSSNNRKGGGTLKLALATEESPPFQTLKSLPSLAPAVVDDADACSDDSKSEESVIIAGKRRPSSVLLPSAARKRKPGGISARGTRGSAVRAKTESPPPPIESQEGEESEELEWEDKQLPESSVIEIASPSW
eukprot:CAMPEP_0185031990 /NCGR_PEP_ID=MMETSP1103-20130426/19793_1 /TAXON_ID=36769 /ORGANISM="Paraphysomonas bandaiensis, Strain Caron Lab Isolate" /LENGTH=623 /DNA_ID=CAMNT_0027567719 /DNA_START=81 /DNA_END=1952 /DNA_ORIENTATION=-